MKRQDTLRDSPAEHDTDPTPAVVRDTTEPGGVQEPADVDDILDGFSGRPRTYYAKHQAGSNGRSAAKYDAVVSPAKAHTDPGEVAPVILAATVEEPVGRILQEASRLADARATLPLVRVAKLPDAERNETTTPGMRSRSATPGWLVPALVVSALLLGAVLYVTRSPASDLEAPIVMSVGVEPDFVRGLASASGVVAAEASNSAPAAPNAATMPVRSAPTVMPAAPPIHSSPSSSSPRPTRPTRPPEAAPSSSAAPTSSSPRSDMKRNFE